MIGTSACKVAVFEKIGNVLGLRPTREYPVSLSRRRAWAEQNPGEWWSAVCQGGKRRPSKKRAYTEEIARHRIDGRAGSAIAMTRKENVLTNTPIWMDTSSTVYL